MPSLRYGFVSPMSQHHFGEASDCYALKRISKPGGAGDILATRLLRVQNGAAFRQFQYFEVPSLL